MFQNKPRDKCRLFGYRWMRPYILSSGSFCNSYSTICDLFLAFVILLSIPAYSLAENRNQLLTNDPKKPWHIVADEINYDDKAGYYIGKGNVMITKEDKKLTADFIRFDQKTMKVYAKGHVIMTAGEDTLTGTSMEMNLEAETGTIYNGTIFIKENHFYIKGDKIQKTGKDSYAVDKASITTCDSDKPAWKITGRNLKVTIEGYGFVKHAALWAKKVPVLYTPFLFFPAKLKRQSGLLPPRIGYSDRKGAEYDQPFYWAINESSDATFYLHHMGRRGENLGLEYRYVLDESSKGTLMFDFLDDKKVDDGTPSSKDWAFENVTGSRPNADRYWFRMKHDQLMPFDFSLKLDIDVVSDQDYLHEFKGGYTGFYETKKNFEKNFGRGIDEYDDTTRVNSLNITKTWSQFSLYGETCWYDSVLSRRQSETYSPLLYLPLINFTGSKQQIFNTPLYFDLNSEYKYSYKRLGTKTQHAEIYPRIYLPLNLKNYLSFETSLGFRETVWDINEYESSSGEGTYNRDLYDFKLDLQTDIYKVFNMKGKRIDRIKHTINPQIVYYYIPEERAKDEYPEGRTGQTNLLTYSITNTFTAKLKENREKSDVPFKNESDVLPEYTYLQFCRFKLEQSYNIEETREATDNPEPFSPIYGEIEIVPGKYFSINADAKWNYYESAYDSHNVRLNIWDNRRDTLYVEHRYERDSSESVYYHVLLRISDKIQAYGEYERNLYDSQDIKTGIGVLYRAQCWGIDFHYLDTEDEKTYAVMFNLYGLGEMGRQFWQEKTED